MPSLQNWEKRTFCCLKPWLVTLCSGYPRKLIQTALSPVSGGHRPAGLRTLPAPPSAALRLLRSSQQLLDVPWSTNHPLGPNNGPGRPAKDSEVPPRKPFPIETVPYSELWSHSLNPACVRSEPSR